MIEFTATTHPGNRYQHNEDSIGWSEEAGLWFVADGIGGHARGDLASATVKQALLEAVEGPEQALTDLVLLAHHAVLRESAAQSLANMGSTLVLARVRENRLNIAWCGDSRAYLWRSGKLSRLTRDHSLLEQLLESGVVAPEEAFGHPRRNVLVQALGISEPPPVPSEVRLSLDNNDVVLLCSDGLHDELHDDSIADVLAAMSHSNPVSTREIVDELERRVLATDARDNLSVICLQAVNLAPRAKGALLDVEALDDNAQTRERSAMTTRQRFVPTRKLPRSSQNSSQNSDEVSKSQGQSFAHAGEAPISGASESLVTKLSGGSWLVRLMAMVSILSVLIGLGWLLLA